MATKPSVSWYGLSGKSYEYFVYPIDTKFESAAANYVYAKLSLHRTWVPVYIGQTGDLRERLPDHEKRPCAIRQGATHIHAHRSGDEHERRVEEADLIRKYKPRCNTQLV